MFRNEPGLGSANAGTSVLDRWCGLLRLWPVLMDILLDMEIYEFNEYDFEEYDVGFNVLHMKYRMFNCLHSMYMLSWILFPCLCTALLEGLLMKTTRIFSSECSPLGRY